jgi:hypothetical protein
VCGSIDREMRVKNIRKRRDMDKGKREYGKHKQRYTIEQKGESGVWMGQRETGNLGVGGDHGQRIKDQG